MKNITAHDILLAKYLSNECTTEEKIMVEEWLNESNENQKLFNELKCIYDKSKGDSPIIFDSQKAWGKIEQRTILKQKRISKLPHKLFKYAAAILIFAISTYLLILSQKTATTKDNPKNGLIVISNGEAKAKMVKLPDSSTIWLNKNSSIAYQERFKENRSIELKGEAFFNVQRDTAHPFTIKTSNTKTTVLGTSFNIKSTDKQTVQLSVISGKVKFEQKNSQKTNYFLGKNEQAIYSKYEQSITKSEVLDKNLLSWKTGVLTFENSNLEYIAQTLSNHYHTAITIQGGIPQNLSFTSTFKNENLENVLDIISSTLNIETIKANNQFILKTN